MAGSVSSHVHNTGHLGLDPHAEVRDRGRARAESDNRTTTGGYPHDDLSQGFNSRRLADRGNRYLNRRAASCPAPSVRRHDPDETRTEVNVHHHDPDETRAEVNTLRRIVQSLNSELNELRQRLQDRGENPATPARQENPAVRQARERLEDERELANLNQEMRDFQLATKMQKMEDERVKQELDREMSQAITGGNFLEKASRAAESQTR